jgi:hypothetical protein
MSEKSDLVVLAVEAATRAAHDATGRRSIITLIALAHAFAAWRESCLRDDRTCEVDPSMARLVAQVDAMLPSLATSYSEAADAERIDRAIESEVTLVRVFSPAAANAKGAA